MKILSAFFLLCSLCACNHKPSVDPIDASIGIYPNPVSNQLNVSILNDHGDVVKVWLLNAEGKVAFEEKSNNSYVSFSIDVSHLPKGNYYLEGTKAGKPFRKLFTKL